MFIKGTPYLTERPITGKNSKSFYFFLLDLDIIMLMHCMHTLESVSLYRNPKFVKGWGSENLLYKGGLDKKECGKDEKGGSGLLTQTK